MESTWLVLGATSPVGRAFALEAAHHGSSLLLAGRNAEELETIAADIKLRAGQPVAVVMVDAEDFDGHQAFVDKCLAQRKGVMNVFLAFGAMYPQEAVDGDFTLAKRTINANYVGPVSILSRIAPVMEKQGEGSIVALGSVAGDRGRLKNYMYGSAKAGLHAYLQGLRARLFRAGVSVTTVKPGFVDTAMTWGLTMKLPMASPEKLAQACWRYAEKGVDTAYYPRFWWPIMSIIKLVPEKVFKRMRF